MLVIAPTPYFSDRGCHIRIAEELQCLYAAGHTAVVYTYHLGRNVGPAPIHRHRRIPWYHKTSAGPSWHKFYLDALLVFKILRTVRRGQFDIIHAHLHEGVAIGWLVARWFHLPLVADLQSQLTAELKSYGWTLPGLARLVRWCEGSLVKRADWIFVSAPQALTLLQNYYPQSRAKMELLLDGVAALPPARLTPEASQVVPTIIYAGGMSQAKGMPVLVSALEQLTDQGLAFKVQLIGVLPTELRHRLNNSSLKERIENIKHIPYEHLSTLLQQADIGVDPKPPTSSESSGKIMNYMAAGLATVAFRSSTTLQLVAEAGSLVTEPTATALAETLKTLLQDKAQRTQLGQAARQRIQNHFLWPTLFTPVVQRYEQLAK